MSEPNTRPGLHNAETGEYASGKAVTVTGNGNSTSTSFSWARLSSNKDLILGIMLGIAIIEGGALFYEWRHQAQQSELKRYELSDFNTTHFLPLAAQVKSDHDLIQAYGIQKIVETTCRSK